jgi:hypothetical protein
MPGIDRRNEHILSRLALVRADKTEVSDVSGEGIINDQNAGRNVYDHRSVFKIEARKKTYGVVVWVLGVSMTVQASVRFSVMAMPLFRFMPA